MRRAIALLLAAAAIAAAATSSAEEVDPCERQPFRGRCPNSKGPPTRSQFVLRYYMRHNECVSYPFGHCANDETEPSLFRYKEECEEACLAPGNLWSDKEAKENKDKSSSNSQESFETYGTLGPLDKEKANPSTAVPVPTTPLATTTRSVPSTTQEAQTTPPPPTTQAPTTAATQPAPTTTTAAAPKTECERRRAAAASATIKGGFVPTCNAAGAFERTQCEPDGRQCFCVSAAGIELPNSRTRDGSRPECEQIATAHASRTNECVGIPETGPCSSSLVRWHYDEEAIECRRFSYSGCGGNGNNYETEEACRDRCVPVSVECPRGMPLRNTQGYFINCAKQSCPSGYTCNNIGGSSICCEAEKKSEVGDLNTHTGDICAQPKERGPCDKYELRFYYNAEMKECKYFFFGGCEGNGNNFDSVEACESRCGVKRGPAPTTTTQQQTRPPTTTTTARTNPPTTTAAPTRRPTPEAVPLPISRAPVQPIQHQAQEERSPVVVAPQPENSEANRCAHALDAGNCQGHFVRWFWNAAKSNCEVFTYTGCQGNGNNFASREECLSICHVTPTASTINVCRHEVDAGECNGVFQRFAFDSEAGECRPYTYGGCGGNGNNFATMLECRQRCQADMVGGDVCTSAIEKGECSGVFERFAFDRAVGDCRPFNYGGCGGNGNNFATAGECRTQCSHVLSNQCPPRPPCDLARCQMLLDVRGCPFCSCPPGATVPTGPVCPPVDPTKCVDPCVSFTNRLGCVDCSCPRAGEASPPPPTFEPEEEPETASPRAPETPRPTAPSTTQRPTTHQHIAPPAPTTAAAAPPAHHVASHPIATAGPPAPAAAPGHQAHAVPILRTQNKQPLAPPTKVHAETPKFEGPTPTTALPSDLTEKCLQAADAGPCDRFVERFFFDAKDGRCHTFRYGGCAGNRNHFFSKRECEIHCARFSRPITTEEPAPTTALPVVVDGAGRQPIPEQPVGIAAESEALPKLDETPAIDTKAACGLPAEPGPCFNYSPRWHFNSASGRCEQFSFGGCGGNGNNFAERETCEARCIGETTETLATIPERCTLPKAVGAGAGYIIKYYFNMASLRCEEFVFEGVGGNDNRFDSGSECEKICTPTAFPADANLPLGEDDDYSSEEIAAQPEDVFGRDEPGSFPLNKPLTSIDDATDLETAPAAVPAAPVVHASKTDYKSDPIRTVVDENGVELPIVAPSPPETINYASGRRNAQGIRTFDQSNGRIPIDVAEDVDDDVEGDAETPAAMPSCPNSAAELKYQDGRSVMCLPGKNQCPEKSVCYFNGLDYFCCPEEEDPYDKHVFGGYNGEETKHGYKNFAPLMIRRLKDDVPVHRVKRQAEEDLDMDSVVAPLRFDGAPIKQISSARSATAVRRHPGSKRPKTPCDYPLEKGACSEAHLRYFYDKSSDGCKLFHYSGCNGNANNFGSLSDCQEMCVKNVAHSATAQQKLASHLPPGQCPQGGPLGGSAPVLCGNTTESIGCPRGFFCRSGPPDVCCPEISLSDIVAAPAAVEKAPAPSTTTTTTKAPQLYCPDASDPLLTKSGKVRTCGSGFDGLKMCPKGHYCAIDAERGTRLCCPLLGSASRIPYQHGVIPPYLGRRPANTGEVIERGSLPADQAAAAASAEMDKKAMDDFIVPSKASAKGSLEKFIDEASVESGEANDDGDYDELARLMLKPTDGTAAEQQAGADLILASAENERTAFNAAVAPVAGPTPEVEGEDEGEKEVKESSDKSRCMLKPVEGRPCRENEEAPRTNLHYFYSEVDGRCKLYFYKGCGGNDNRFERKSDCEAACMA